MNKINKKTISIFVLIIVLILFIFLIYLLTYNIRNYRNKVLDDYVNLAQLELDKKSLDMYKKILSKDSMEYRKVQKYILFDNRKDLLNLINQIDEYAKKNALVGLDSTTISSISKRENALITKYKSRDLVINITVNGNIKKIEDFIKLLNNMPLVSYIEKIDIKYDHINNNSSANIVLIIYQKDEIK